VRLARDSLAEQNRHQNDKHAGDHADFSYPQSHIYITPFRKFSERAEILRFVAT